MPEPIASDRRYMPGLDGLRTLAVLAVVAYHLGFGWAQGGLLGVAVFFTLSGYLITDLLLTQFETRKRIDLARFWTARARRLLPALFAMLLIVSIWVWADDRAQLATVRGQVFAGLLYISNWWQSFQHISYFARFGPPSPLNHLWSLAVEEQFYLVWPLLLILGLRYVKERPRSGPFRPRLARLTLLLGVISAVEMALLFHPGFDPSRVYYGTDTRAFGLLFGAALACVWPSRKLSSQVGRHAGGVMDVVGTIGLIGIVLMIWRTTEYSQFLYRGGFVLLSLFTVMAIAGLTHPAAKLAGVMGAGPMRWLGVRSYGIYLWHAPIIALTTPNASHGVQLWRAALQVAASIGIAALSWKYLEDPIRHGGLGALTSRFGSGRRRAAPRYTTASYGSSGGGYASAAYAPTLQLSARRRRSIPAPGVLALSGAVLLAVLCLSGALASPFKPIVSPASISQVAGDSTNVSAVYTSKTNGPTHAAGRSSHGSGAGGRSASKGNDAGKSSNAGTGPGTKTTTKANGSHGPPMTSCTSVVHIGDSTSEGLIPSGGFLFDSKQDIPEQYERVGVKTVHMEVSGGTSIVEVAETGTENAYQVAQGLIQQGYNGCWVLALGLNDAADVEVGSNVSDSQRIEKMMNLLHGQPVMWVNNKTLLDSEPYAETNMQAWNEHLVAGCSKYPNMRVYDWADAVKTKWFQADGTHYTSIGYAARSELIANALARAFPANGKAPSSCLIKTEPLKHLHLLRSDGKPYSSSPA